MRLAATRVLSEMNCCVRCVLRLLGERDISLYGNPQQVKGFNITKSMLVFEIINSIA